MRHGVKWVPVTIWHENERGNLKDVEEHLNPRELKPEYLFYERRQGVKVPPGVPRTALGVVEMEDTE